MKTAQITLKITLVTIAAARVLMKLSATVRCVPTTSIRMEPALKILLEIARVVKTMSNILQPMAGAHRVLIFRKVTALPSVRTMSICQVTQVG